jgi:tetratricopeptide (TPR) repeat protein
MSTPVNNELYKEYFNNALQMHKKGEIEGAKIKYEEVLEAKPNHFDSLYLLGMIAHQQQDLNLAVDYLSQAVKINNTNPEVFFNLGVIYEDNKDHEKALHNYSNAINLKADHLEALFNRAKIYAAKGNLEFALSDLQKISQKKAGFAGVQEFIAQLTNTNKEVITPVNTISSMQSLEIEDDTKIRRFIDLHEKAMQRLNLNQISEAISLFDEALNINPKNAEAHHNRGMALEKKGDFQGALISYRYAIEYKPDSAESYNNTGNVLRELGLLNSAIEHFEKAIFLKPNYPEAFNNLGWTKYCMQEYAQSIEHYESALSLDPNLHSARFNLSLSNLMLGDYVNGWGNYEARLKISKYQTPKVTGLQWDGKASLANKTILVYAEQGLGDTLQFCRYIALLNKLNAKVIFQVQPELIELFKNQTWIANYLSPGAVLPHLDYNIPLMSLPKAFGTTLDTIPNLSPYISPDEHKVSYWANKLSSFRGSKVGIVWHGGFRKSQPELWGVNQRRNVPLQELAGINLNEVNFFSLQVGDGQYHEWPNNNFYDYTSEFANFSDTAALIANLDLVISVDTSTAHLAAAMGKPIWILNRFDNCWRWMSNKKDSAWYPSASLYRQAKPSDWQPVIQDIYSDLREFILHR